MLPLLKFGHLIFLETKTRLFQVLTSILWDYLGERSPNLHQICSLLYQLNNCLDSGLVERVIGHRISSTHKDWQSNVILSNATTSSRKNYVILDQNVEKSIPTERLPDYTSDRLYDVKIMCLPPVNTVQDCNDYLIETQFSAFRKFEILWHLGRDCHGAKDFDVTLLKMLDKLALPYHSSIRIFVTKWLQESFIRGDLSRIIRPLLKIMFAPSTKKIGILHAHSLRKTDNNLNELQSDKGQEDSEEAILGKDIYAIHNEDGNVSYHIETPPSKTRSSPIRSLQKKFFGVAIGTKYKMTNYINDRLMTPDSNSLNNTSNNISLIINPMENSIETIERERSLSSSAPSQTATEHDDSKMISFKEDYYSSADDDMSLDSSNESESIKSGKESGRFSLNPVTSDDVKRFVGNTNEVCEILSEHDRTKNKKTYHLTKNRKFDAEEDNKSEGRASIEESTAAEEYFSSSSANEIVMERVVNELIMEAIDKIDDEDNSKPRIRRNKHHNKLDKKSRHSTGNIVETALHKSTSDSKRLSCTSKTSSSSNYSNYSDSKDSDNEVDPNNEKTSSQQSSNFDVSKSIKSLNNNNESNRNEKTSTTVNDTNLNKLNAEKKINWEKTKEAMYKVKKNVEILRQNSEREVSEEKQKIQEKIHPFHSHMLLYYGVYDTEQVLYAFQTLRNIIACDCRTFVCLSFTNAVSNSQIKQLLIR